MQTSSYHKSVDKLLVANANCSVTFFLILKMPLSREFPITSKAKQKGKKNSVLFPSKRLYDYVRLEHSHHGVSDNAH